MMPRLLAVLGVSLLALAAQAEPPRAERSESAVGASLTLYIDGVGGMFTPIWRDNPKGIVEFVHQGNSKGIVKGLRPGQVTVSAKIKGLFGSDTYSTTLQVVDKATDGRDDPGAVKLMGLMRGMGFPDTDTRIARLLYEVTNEIRGADSFYKELGDMGAKMTDVIALRSRLVDMPDSSLARQVMGPAYPEGGTLVEQRIPSWRKQQTLAAIDDVLAKFSGWVPAKGVKLIVSPVGKWATQDPRSLQFPGDIDFSFVSNDIELAQAMRREFLEVIKQRTKMDQISIDSVCTAHGKAGLEVYIGRHGMQFAEEMMKINQIVDLEKGTIKPAGIEEVTDILTKERAMLDSQGKDVVKPVHDTEPGLCMEMARHFDHDIAKSGIPTTAASSSAT